MTTKDIPADVAALGAFVEAANDMSPTELRAALRYLFARYGVPGVRERVMVEFAALLTQSTLLPWNQREAKDALAAAFDLAWTNSSDRHGEGRE